MILLDINYFNHKIEECVNNRKEEISIMQGKQISQPIEDENFNILMQEEIKKMPLDLYREALDINTGGYKLRPKNKKQD